MRKMGYVGQCLTAICKCQQRVSGCSPVSFLVLGTTLCIKVLMVFTLFTTAALFIVNVFYYQHELYTLFEFF